jgi:uncharacterized membrane protein
MSEIQDANSNAGREQKRAQFTAPAARNRKTAWFLVPLALLAGIAYFAFNREGDTSAASEVAAAANDPAQDAVVVPVADLTPGKAKFFEYVARNKTRARFFVVKTPDGVHRAALDACDVCYKAKKGYSQSGEDMVCRQCGQTFAISRVNEESGGCNPTPLQRTLADGNILIRKSELESLTRYF